MKNTLVRTRRHRKRVKETTVQLITFQLRQDWFALPITAVERVIPLEAVYGEAHQSGIGLTVYQGQELVVVDVGQRLFGEAGQAEGTLLHLDASQQDVLDQVQLLLILKAPTGKPIGIPIDSRPVLKRVVAEAIAPIPHEYQTSGKIQCVSSLSVQAAGEPLLFLLDTEQLFEALALSLV